MVVIAITGTPGTGKTAVSAILKRHGWQVLDLNKEIVRNKLYTGRDTKRKSFIADMPAVQRFVKKNIKSGDWLVVSHLSHLLPASMVDAVIVLRCRPDRLRLRLKAKRWSKAKVNENFEAELIGLIAVEARQKHRKVYDIDTTKRTAKQSAALIGKVLKGKGERYRTTIDWLMIRG